MVDHFPPGSLIRRVNEEPAIGLGAGRALLLQLAHPHVAAGVDEHSEFQDNPFKRLFGTLEAVYTMVFGSKPLAEGVGRRIQWIHTFVTGPGYQANDPANLMWVHATLLDSAIDRYQALMTPLSLGELETYYQEMAVIAEAFGCPRSEQPADYAAYRAYFDEQVAAIEVSDVGRRLAADIVSPKLPLKLHWPLAPPLALFRLMSVGTLPASLREQLGFAWDDAKQRRLERFEAVMRWLFRMTPRPVRVAPAHLQGRVLLRQARRHVAEFEARALSQQAA